MTLKKRFDAIKKKFLEMILLSELSNAEVSRSIVVGFGCGFLPFPGFQTPFLFPICWSFRLNFPLMYLCNWLVNNWFTTLPIVIISIWLGQSLLAAVGFSLPPVSFQNVALNVAFIKSVFVPFVVGSLTFMILVMSITYYPTVLLVNRIRKNAVQ